MKKKLRIITYWITTILCVSLAGCGSVSTQEKQPAVSEEAVVTEEPEEKSGIGPFPLSAETENFLFGKWKVKKLLGFYNAWNDASEYPNGQDIIGDEIIIQPDVFSSVGLKKYKAYQDKYKNPYYYVDSIFYDTLSLYRAWKLEIPELEDNDKVQAIKVSSKPREYPAPMSFFCINNERLILSLEATIFELEKIEE